MSGVTVHHDRSFEYIPGSFRSLTHCNYRCALSQGQGPYAKQLKKVETDIKDVQKRVNEKMGKSQLTCARPSRSLLILDLIIRREGIGHRTGTSESMGFTSRQAAYGRGAPATSSSLHQDSSLANRTRRSTFARFASRTKAEC